MHHLPVDTGGGGGRQVRGPPPGCLLLTVLSVFNYAFGGVSVCEHRDDTSPEIFVFFLKRKNNPKGVVMNNKPQSALKLPASWSCLFGTESGFF